MWISSSELADTLNVSESAIWQWIHREKIAPEYYRYSAGGKRGGKTLGINPIGLPEPHQTYWIKEYMPQHLESHRSEIDVDLYTRLKPYQKEYVDRWLGLFQLCKGLKGKQLKNTLAVFAYENTGFSCSYQTYRRNQKAYDEQGIAGIVPDWGKREGDSVISDSDFELFKSLYLKQSRPTAESCWELVRGAAWKIGRDITDFPHPKTFLRRLEKEIPEATIYLSRNGHHNYNKKYGYYIDRDKSEIKAGSCWVGDHRQIDLFVINKAGKPYRPWITFWMDFKSGKWISWYPHEADPNSDHIFQSFKWGIEEFGLPETCYIDNGKDYRSKDFAGGTKKVNVDIDEQHSRSMLLMLGITPHFALPYNAQAKNIERAFRNFIMFLEQHMPGYAGKNSAERPEETLGLIKKGKILDEDTFKELLDRFILEKLNKKVSDGKELQGLSPNELFYKEKNLKVAPRSEALKLFCMRTSGDRVIGRNGVQDSETRQKYYAEWMAGQKGRKVYLRRDLNQYQEAWVFDSATNEFLGKAILAPAINGLAQTDIDREQVRELNRRKRREEHMYKSYLSDLDNPAPADIIEWSIANEKATEEQRRAKGEFQDYDETLNVSWMKDTKADEIIEKDRNSKTGTDNLDDILPNDLPKSQQLKSIWED